MLARPRSGRARRYDGLDEDDRACLDRVAARVKHFAETQRAAIRDAETDIPGGKAGHTVKPVEVAGCYAPGGRYPLPSSVIMTAATARAARGRAGTVELFEARGSSRVGSRRRGGARRG